MAMRSRRNLLLFASLMFLRAAPPPPVAACGFGFVTLADETTFEPAILGKDTWDGLYFDPFQQAFGGACEDCQAKAALDDWNAYLPGFGQIIANDNVPALTARRAKATGKEAAALDYALVLRDAPPEDAPSAAFARTQLAAAKGKDAFLAQRYTFLAIRGLFYAHEWRACAAAFDSMKPGPSTDLAWRARYYAAGALAKAGARGRANLELARIVSGYPALAGAAMFDFKPMEEADWQATLRLARDNHERAELWRLVGIKLDGVTATQKILELEPRSNLVALLLVRELSKDEGPDDKAKLAALEQLATRVAAIPGADRPWVAELVAGHVAAKRGDLPVARTHLKKAMQLAPNDVAVTTQASASLALALALDWKIDAAHEAELAELMVHLDAGFSRTQSVTAAVRANLAKAYALAGKIVESEMLNEGAGRWEDVGFVKAMIAAQQAASTPFQRFVAQRVTPDQLRAELFGRYLMMGDFFDAKANLPAADAKLGTDPFVAHIRDCHDCDHETFANAPWTTASFATHLVELQSLAAGKSAAAAKANLELGNAMYNVTWYGNARVVLEGTHQATRDTRVAEKLYKRAYDLAKDRELRAQAAFFAAKAELGRLQSPDSSELPVPTTWFTALKALANTRYAQQVLAECGNFRAWMDKQK